MRRSSSPVPRPPTRSSPSPPGGGRAGSRRVAIGPVAEESVAILRETAGTSVDLACALVGLGQSRLLAGDLAGAARELAEALAVARASRPRYWITYALYWQGCVAQASGDLAAARAAFDEGVALALEDGYNAPIEIGRASCRERV